MSIDINWETLTGGQDGADLCESIKSFIHERFQQVALPRFVRSVQVHAFEFGSVPPDVELKDVCDPLPDFYDDDDDDDDEDSDEEGSDRSTDVKHNEGDGGNGEDGGSFQPHRTSLTSSNLAQNHSNGFATPLPSKLQLQPKTHENQSAHGHTPRPAESPSIFNLPRGQFSGIPGGTSNFSYFHLPLGVGLSGSSTPLAAVAGNHHHLPANGWSERYQSQTNLSQINPEPHLQRDQREPLASPVNSLPSGIPNPTSFPPSPPPEQERSTANDVQIVLHLTYCGDVRLALTADILLDYPMPSFVGIPLQLTVTGLSFDGVAILAHIKKKAHFCFLSPEDADALIGGEERQREPRPEDDEVPVEKKPSSSTPRKPIGNLFSDIKVESEIGQRPGQSPNPLGAGSSGQVLKNVEKVEKFVLEQTRRIFEDELVYPSFWSFLI